VQTKLLCITFLLIGLASCKTADMGGSSGGNAIPREPTGASESTGQYYKPGIPLSDQQSLPNDQPLPPSTTSPQLPGSY